MHRGPASPLSPNLVTALEHPCFEQSFAMVGKAKGAWPAASILAEAAPAPPLSQEDAFALPVPSSGSSGPGSLPSAGSDDR
jgi:hypothetical protein